MTRVMFDSTNVADDPLGAQLVAYYVDGIYATTAAKVRQRFPSAVLVAISAIGSNAGIVGDVEPGCMSLSQALAWVIMRRGAGVDPSLYVNEVYGWESARLMFQKAGVPEPHWWVADYDNVAVVPAGAMAKQYENPPLTHGHFDRSVAADYWPGVDALAGNPSHEITTPGGEPMAYFLVDSATIVAGSGAPLYIVFEQDGKTVKRHLTGAEWAAYAEAGGVAKADPNKALAAIPDYTAGAALTTGGSVAPDQSAAILAAIADWRAHPSFDPADAATLAIVTKFENAARAAGAAA